MVQIWTKLLHSSYHVQAAIKQQEELLKKLDAPGVSDAEKLALLERLQEQDKILEELRSLANATSKAANKVRPVYLKKTGTICILSSFFLLAFLDDGQPKPSAPTAEQGPQTSEAATEPAVASAVQAAPAPVTSTEQSMHARGRYFSGAPRSVPDTDCKELFFPYQTPVSGWLTIRCFCPSVECSPINSGRGMYMSRGRGRGRGRGPATTVLRVTGFAPEDKDELTPHFAVRIFRREFSILFLSPYLMFSHLRVVQSALAKLSASC